MHVNDTSKSHKVLSYGTGDFTRSECMNIACACVIDTNLHTLSAACALALSSYININFVRGTCAL